MIYVDESGKVIENPDMTKGKIVDGSEKQVVTKHHDAVAEQSHWETMKRLNDKGAIVDYVDDSGKPIQRKIIDVPAQVAYDETDTQVTYHAYTISEQQAYDAGQNAGARIVTNEANLSYIAMMMGVDI